MINNVKINIQELQRNRNATANFINLIMTSSVLKVSIRVFNHYLHYFPFSHLVSVTVCLAFHCFLSWHSRESFSISLRLFLNNIMGIWTRLFLSLIKGPHFTDFITRTFVKLQTGWSQDQVPYMRDLILAPVCLPPATGVL